MQQDWGRIRARNMDAKSGAICEFPEGKMRDLRYFSKRRDTALMGWKAD